MSSPTVSPSAQEIGALVRLVDRERLSEAETGARRLLARFPDVGIVWKILSVALVRQEKDALPALRRAAELLPADGETHRNLASALQARGEFASALQSLHRALEIQPHDADGFAEAADAMRALGRPREAVPLYERALLLDPTLTDARNDLGNAFLELRQYWDAARCYRQAVEARPEDPVILCNLGNVQRLLGLWEEACVTLRRAIDLDPLLGFAHTCLGWVLRDLGRRREAVHAFERAIAIDASRAENHDNLGTVLFDLRRVDAAGDCFRQALTLQPDHAPAHLHLALALRQQRRFSEALASCRAALAIEPSSPEAVSFLGELHADRGEFEEAERLFRKAVALDPNFVSAYSSIATHRKMTVDDSEWLRGAQASLARRLPPAHELGLRYAIGKYYDDLKRYDEAFDHYRLANDLASRHGARHDRAKLTQRVDGIIGRFDAAFVQQNRPHASNSRLPVFIIGMPRSGTSLAEQILASHPKAYGAGEVIFWNAAYDSQVAQDRRGTTHESSLSRMASQYLTLLTASSGGAERVIDKMPANFFYAGLIHAAFPQARIIHMRRHPIDTCLSIYFQNFFNIGPYAHDLADLAHYYGEYVRITDHWRSVLPAAALLEISYEALIEDQEGWTRRMLEFAGLPWDPKCLEFHRTDRVVITASKWQVRQRIHSGSSGRWRHYEKHIGPLRQLVSSDPWHAPAI